jgi:predicted GH43/DUF377 family glycosyl hydrolase
MGGSDLVTLLLVLGVFVLCMLAAAFLVIAWLRQWPSLKRLRENPILEPKADSWWESQAVFNPGVVYDGEWVHLFYRALGHDGISRIGYARSRDGVHFERFPRPAYDPGVGFAIPEPMPGVKTKGKLSYATLTYDTDLYASGGGWGGSEDPRAVIIDGRLYMTFGVFESWQSMRLAVTSLPLTDLRHALWHWSPHIPMSPKEQTNKNWVLFPEKIHGAFAVLHALTPKISVEYVDDLETLREKPIQSNNQRSGRPGHWDAFVRGAAAPPIKTNEGWLLLYHGMNPAHGAGYNVGAMLLDLSDPTKVLYRSEHPILVPKEWYENDWKEGVVYASGAVVKDGELIVYYGGGDKRIAAASVPLKTLLRDLANGDHAVLAPVKV